MNNSVDSIQITKEKLHSTKLIINERFFIIFFILIDAKTLNALFFLSKRGPKGVGKGVYLIFVFHTIVCIQNSWMCILWDFNRTNIALTNK